MWRSTSPRQSASSANFLVINCEADSPPLVWAFAARMGAAAFLVGFLVLLLALRVLLAIFLLPQRVRFLQRLSYAFLFNHERNADARQFMHSGYSQRRSGKEPAL